MTTWIFAIGIQWPVWSLSIESDIETVYRFGKSESMQKHIRSTAKSYVNLQSTYDKSNLNGFNTDYYL